MSGSGRLEGQVAVVTGAGRGIGREIALLMAAEGAAVVVNDIGTSIGGDGRDQSPAEDVAGEIVQSGGRAIARHDSVTEWAATQHLVEAAIGEFGRLDCVVNNAGILRDAIFHKMSESDWDAVIGVHLKGSFNVSRAAAPHFRERQAGAFVHMTSTSGLIGNVGQANYSAAKMGIVGLSRSIALDMKRFGVRSNCVSPFANTRMIGSIPDSPDQAQRLARLNAMMPATVAPLVAFLASDAAAGITGQVFAVRANEVFLFNQPRPIRSLHADSGWTVQTLAERAVPALKSSLVPLEVSGDVFNWDPV